VGGACRTHGRGEKSVEGFGGKARRKETTLTAMRMIMMMIVLGMLCLVVW
jgi:hypothetical protein